MRRIVDELDRLLSPRVGLLRGLSSRENERTPPVAVSELRVADRLLRELKQYRERYGSVNAPPRSIGR